MAFDYKKEYKEFYMPKGTPSIVTVPKMNYIAVRGSGNPNDEDGEYKKAIGLLYGIAFTIKMSRKGDHQIDGYFDYVVPPLEGFWWQDGIAGADYANKDSFRWISVIRLPDFVTKDDFDWAVREAADKKKQDFSKVEFFSYEEGLCVQCMHIGSYDDEPATVEAMHIFMEEQGYVLDITDQRMHHEIYLSDARKTAPEKLKTVIRHPIRKMQEQTDDKKNRNKDMKEKYYDQAVACVKDEVLPAQIELYRSCDGDLDRVYGEAMNGNGYFGKVIEPGRVYELGYERCTCPKVLSGRVTDPEQCECSKQSILYILGCLEPDSRFEVDVLETVLRGAEHCRFRITKKQTNREG